MRFIRRNKSACNHFQTSQTFCPLHYILCYTCLQYSKYESGVFSEPFSICFEGSRTGKSNKFSLYSKLLVGITSVVAEKACI